MSQGWYYSKDRRTRMGPVSAAELRELARTGQVAPTDLVQREGTDTWQPAGQLKGLFDRPPATRDAGPAASAEDGSVARGVTAGGLRSHAAVLVLALLCCFPAGLALIWTNRSWSSTRKGVWTGAWAAVMLVFMVVASAQQAATNKSLDEADRLWAAGQKAEAVAKYKDVIDGGVSSVAQSRRPTVFQRVIEHEAEQGSTSAAKQYIQKAETYNVALASDAPAARTLLAEAKAEKEEAEARKRAEDGRAAGSGNVPEFITVRDGSKCRTKNALVHERAYALLRPGMTPDQVRNALGEEPSVRKTDEKGNVFWVYNKATKVGLAFGSRGEFKGRLGFLVIDGKIQFAGDQDLRIGGES